MDRPKTDRHAELEEAFEIGRHGTPEQLKQMNLEARLREDYEAQEWLFDGSITALCEKRPENIQTIFANLQEFREIERPSNASGFSRYGNSFQYELLERLLSRHKSAKIQEAGLGMKSGFNPEVTKVRRQSHAEVLSLTLDKMSPDAKESLLDEMFMHHHDDQVFYSMLDAGVRPPAEALLTALEKGTSGHYMHDGNRSTIYSYIQVLENIKDKKLAEMEIWDPRDPGSEERAGSINVPQNVIALLQHGAEIKEARDLLEKDKSKWHKQTAESVECLSQFIEKLDEIKSKTQVVADKPRQGIIGVLSKRHGPR